MNWFDVPRFAAKIRKTDTCWLWTACKFPSGYAQIRANGKTMLAHRLAWESVNGQIPTGLTLDHLCRVRNCVNPSHLEAVTIRENILRGHGEAATNAIKVRCMHGHLLSRDNLYESDIRRGWRTCRTCVLARSAVNYRRRRGLSV